MMNFINPLFLAGLAAAAIPLLIFLWNRNRKPVVRVSSLFLFRQIEQSSIRSLKITSLILLLLRILILILLALAFAQPFWHRNDSPPPLWDVIVVDMGPELGLLADAQRDVIFSKVGQWLQDHPGTRVQSTDSLSGFQYRSGLPVTWFQGLPPIDSTHRVLFITAQGSPVLNRITGRSPALTTWIVYETPGMENNAGIRSVELPGGLWQAGIPNPVEIQTRLTGSDASRASLSVYLDDVLIRTVPITTTDAQEPVTIPVTPTTRGWHSLTVDLQSPDFAADNRWKGGFYLPETLSVVAPPSASIPALDWTRFADALARSGMPVRFSANPAQLSPASTLILSGNQWFPAASGHRYRVIIPDFQQPAALLSQIGNLDLRGSVRRAVPTIPGRYANHPFLAYLNSTDPEPNSTVPLAMDRLDLAPRAGMYTLLADASGSPLLSLFDADETRTLLFHVNPFAGSTGIPSWALSALIQAVQVLPQTATLESGFFASSIRSGSPLVSPVPEPGYRIFLDDQEQGAAAIDTRGRLNNAAVSGPGLLRLKNQDRLAFVSGLNLPLRQPAPLPDEAFTWTGTGDLPLSQTEPPLFLAFGLFLLALLLLLAEMWISRGAVKHSTGGTA